MTKIGREEDKKKGRGGEADERNEGGKRVTKERER